MTYIVIGLLALGLLYLCLSSFAGGAGTIFEKDDPRLLAAKQQARDALPTFWAALKNSDPAEEGFALKFNLLHGSGSEDNESIWAADIREQDGKIFGKLINVPVAEGFVEGQQVEIAPEAIDDWGFWRDGVAQGHYVTRLMIETAPAGTARYQRKAMGWS